VSFELYKLARDTHMSTWVSWTLPFDFSNFQNTFIIIGGLQVAPHMPTHPSHHHFLHVIIIFS